MYNLSQVEAKILEFNADAGVAGLNQAGVASLAGLCAVLKVTNRYHASRVTPDQIAVLPKLLAWPVDKVRDSNSSSWVGVKCAKVHLGCAGSWLLSIQFVRCSYCMSHRVFCPSSGNK